MTDSTLNAFLGYGTAAARAAFTPSPPTPASGAAQAYYWFETDTSDTYCYHGGSWTKVNALASIADKRILANISGGSAGPSANTLSAILDACITSVAQGDILYRDAASWARLGAGTAGQVLKTGGAAANPSWADSIASIAYVIDGGGSTITTGVKGDLVIPFACTIQSATLLADQSGSIVVNVWKDTYANYPPTVADKITASAPPTISSATNSQDATLTGWTTSISAGDTLRFNVDSVTTIQRVTLALKVKKT